MPTQFQNDRVYKVTNVKNTAKVLDLSGADNRSIIGFDFHGGDNQKWQAGLVDGGWTFRNVGTGKYLAVDGQRNAQNNYSNGTKVIGSDHPYTWHVWEEKDFHRVSVPDVKKSLDLSNHGNGPDVEIWGKWEGDNQLWKFEEV